MCLVVQHARENKWRKCTPCQKEGLCASGKYQARRGRYPAGDTHQTIDRGLDAQSVIAPPPSGARHREKVRQVSYKIKTNRDPVLPTEPLR